MRLIDADDLKKSLKDNDWITDDPLIVEGGGLEELIDNAPTIPLPILNEQIAWEQGYEAGLAQAVEITEEQAINKLHETGWLIGHDKEMTERPEAKWIEKEETPASVSYYCSNCEMEGIPITPFCPHCGADMRKGGAE